MSDSKRCPQFTQLIINKTKNILTFFITYYLIFFQIQNLYFLPNLSYVRFYNTNSFRRISIVLFLVIITVRRSLLHLLGASGFCQCHHMGVAGYFKKNSNICLASLRMQKLKSIWMKLQKKMVFVNFFQNAQAKVQVL